MRATLRRRLPDANKIFAGALPQTCLWVSTVSQMPPKPFKREGFQHSWRNLLPKNCPAYVLHVGRQMTASLCTMVRSHPQTHTHSPTWMCKHEQCNAKHSCNNS